MGEDKKRKAGNHDETPVSKRKFSQGRRNGKGSHGGPSKVGSSIEPGDAGIWVTCVRGKEGRCVGELRELLDEYASTMTVPDATASTEETQDNQEDTERTDIEADIGKELTEMNKHNPQRLFEPVRVDMACVVFIRTHLPLDPAGLVHRVCDDANRQIRLQRSRFIQRFTPVTATGKATEDGLEEVAKAVLGPHFHQPDQSPRKFAIRPTIRNHSVLSRDTVIQQIAQAVGHPHTVDLKNYDLLVLVEVWTNICGMSVVGNDYEKLKRYNLLEIYDEAARHGDGG